MTHLASVHVQGSAAPLRSFYHPASARMWAEMMAELYTLPLVVRLLADDEQGAS